MAELVERAAVARRRVWRPVSIRTLAVVAVARLALAQDFFRLPALAFLQRCRLMWLFKRRLAAVGVVARPRAAVVCRPSDLREMAAS